MHVSICSIACKSHSWRQAYYAVDRAYYPLEKLFIASGTTLASMAPRPVSHIRLMTLMTPLGYIINRERRSGRSALRDSMLCFGEFLR